MKSPDGQLKDEQSRECWDEFFFFDCTFWILVAEKFKSQMKLYYFDIYFFFELFFCCILFCVTTSRLQKKLQYFFLMAAVLRQFWFLKYDSRSTSEEFRGRKFVVSVTSSSLAIFDQSIKSRYLLFILIRYINKHTENL